MFKKFYVSDKIKNTVLKTLYDASLSCDDDKSEDYVVIVRKHQPSLTYLKVTLEQIEQLRPYIKNRACGENPSIGFNRMSRIQTNGEVGIAMLKKCNLGFTASGKHLESFFDKLDSANYEV